jgi:dipeptidyl aminopeptidase/acylaminoacyl peptidase
MEEHAAFPAYPTVTPDTGSIPMGFRPIIVAALLVAYPHWCRAEQPMTPAQALSFTTLGDLQFSPDGSELAYVARSYRWDNVPRLRILVVATGKARELTPAKAEERSPAWAPKGRMLAFLSTRGGKTQIYLEPAEAGEPTALTTQKLGVQGFRWSPDGRSIAYLAQDDGGTSEADVPQVADLESNLARLWVIDVTSKSARRVGKDGYRVDGFQWQDATHILVAATDRPRVEEDTDAIYSISTTDGSITLVSRPPQPFTNLLISPDGKQFAVRANGSGGPDTRDLFVGSTGSGDLRGSATPHGLAVAEVHWHEQGTLWVRVLDGFFNRIIRMSNGAAPAQIDLPLSVGSFDVSRNGLIAFVGEDFGHLAQIYLKAHDGSIRQLGESQEGWSGVGLAPTTIFKTRSFDGTEIESALVKPSAVPTGGKYPLVLLVHGGPASNFTARYGWETAWAQLLAAHGYQVLMVNPRGSSGYSEAFLTANRSDWGGGDYRDLMAVLDAVIVRGETDPARLGIGGWSYGGEMSAWAITQTDRFKAAVAGALVYDQQAEFETEDGPAGDEWYFGTPWEHPDVFARNSPATFIGRARTPTLILAGQNDASNPVGQSKGLYRALKHLGVEAQLVLYPGEGHSPRLGSSNIDMFARILDWYDRHLQ